MSTPSVGSAVPDTLDRNSPVPLQRQLLEVFRGKIESGDWQLGELIPRELDLMTQYGVSRYAMRQVLDELTQAGWLVRTKKRGTVVRRPKIEQKLSQFYSFAHDMTAKGLKPVSYVLSLAELKEPDDQTARLLRLADFPVKELYHLQRLRVVDNAPLLIESSFLAFTEPVAMYNHDWRLLSLYDVLEASYGIRVERATEFLEPVTLEPSEAALLGVAPGSPAFRVERLTYDDTGRVFERRISLIRGDRYRFYVELPRVELTI